MNGINIKAIIKKIILIVAASIIYAAGVTLFLDKKDIVPGGVTGMAMIINRFTQIEIGTIIFMFNVPLLIIGAWKFGWKFMFTTLLSIAVSSVFMNIFTFMKPPTEDTLLISLTGGGLVAIGLGYIFKAGATTGGTDIIVNLIRLKYKHITTGRVFLIVDVIVILLFLILFGNVDSALYSVIAVLVCTEILDMILYGKDEAKLLYIISKSEEKENTLVKSFLDELGVGVTYLKGFGAYKNKEKKVIMCAVKKQQLPKAKELVHAIDSSAFMIVTSATEILGEGYKKHGL